MTSHTHRLKPLNHSQRGKKRLQGTLETMYTSRQGKGNENKKKKRKVKKKGDGATGCEVGRLVTTRVFSFPCFVLCGCCFFIVKIKLMWKMWNLQSQSPREVGREGTATRQGKKKSEKEVQIEEQKGDTQVNKEVCFSFFFCYRGKWKRRIAYAQAWRRRW